MPYIVINPDNSYDIHYHKISDKAIYLDSYEMLALENAKQLLKTFENPYKQAKALHDSLLSLYVHKNAKEEITTTEIKKLAFDCIQNHLVKNKTTAILTDTITASFVEEGIALEYQTDSDIPLTIEEVSKESDKWIVTVTSPIEDKPEFETHFTVAIDSEKNATLVKEEIRQTPAL